MNKSHRITTTANLNLKENITSVIENHFGIISPDNHNPDPYASNTINKIEYHFTDNKLTDISVSIKTQDEQDYRVEQQHFNINNPESDLYSETTSNE